MLFAAVDKSQRSSAADCCRSPDTPKLSAPRHWSGSDWNEIAIQELSSNSINEQVQGQDDLHLNTLPSTIVQSPKRSHPIFCRSLSISAVSRYFPSPISLARAIVLQSLYVKSLTVMSKALERCRTTMKTRFFHYNLSNTHLDMTCCTFLA